VRDPERIHDGAFLYDGDRLYFGTDRDTAVQYDAPNARLAIQTKDAAGAYQDVVTVDANTATPAVRIDGNIVLPTVGDRLDFGDLDTSIRETSDDTLVVEVGGSDIYTITATAFTMSDAAGTSDMTLTVENSSDVANSDASLVVKVGGISAGDPAITFVVTGSTNIAGADTYAIGVDNGVTHDPFVIAASSALGTKNMLVLDGYEGSSASIRRFSLPGLTSLMADGATTSFRTFDVGGITLEYQGTTQVTDLQDYNFIRRPNITAAGGAIVIDEAHTFGLEIVRTGHADVTITDGVGLEIDQQDGDIGVMTTQHGIWVKSLSNGGSNYLITLGDADADINLIHVGVTGDPIVMWDESEDAFSLNKGLRITSGVLEVGTPETYSITNVTTDRDVDADTVDVATLADVVGTLIADLRTIGLVN